MTSFAKNCLKCGRPVDSWLHRCPSIVMVVDPVLHHIAEQEAHPLERLTVRDWLKIEGVDVEAEMQNAETQIEEMNAAYLNGPLIHRVECHNLSGLGFQGGVDYWSIAVEGHTDADLHKALDLINSSPGPLISLNRDDTYLCRLVSLNYEGIKYVWKIKRLKYDGEWEMLEF